MFFHQNELLDAISAIKLSSKISGNFKRKLEKHIIHAKTYLNKIMIETGRTYLSIISNNFSNKEVFAM